MSERIVLHPDGSAGYRSAEGHALRRETLHDEGGNLLRGVWVLRDPKGDVIGHDRYRNDLEGRHGVRISEDPTPV